MRIRTPKSVLLSVILLLVVHACALLPVVLYFQHDNIPMSVIFTAIAGLYMLLVLWLFFIVIGKSWARTSYAVFALLGLMAAVTHLPDFDLQTYILWALRVTAVILLYIPMSDSWFMRRNPDSPAGSELQP